MDPSSVSDQIHIFDVYRRYCEVTSESLNLGFRGDGYRSVNESKKAKFYREALSQLLQVVESRVDKRMDILEEIPMLMSRLDLMADSCEFSRFYNFVFFISRENGQRNITVSRAIMAWKLVLSGRFRLLNQWCSFVEKNQRHNISEDTWRQVLAFSRCVHENLEGYDPEGAWPVLIDEFVEHMYRYNFCAYSFWFCNFGFTNMQSSLAHFHITGLNRVNGSEDGRTFCCSCSDSENQPIDDSLPGLKTSPGVKRKLGDDLQDQEFTNLNTIIMNSKKRRSDLENNLGNRDGCITSNPTYNCNETVKHNKHCAVEGCLSNGIAELFSGLSSLQFDQETRVPYSL